MCQEVDPIGRVFWLWVRRSTKNQTYTRSECVTKLLISSLWATYTLSKVIVPSMASKASCISYILYPLDVILESMQQLATGDFELVLSANMFTKILALFNTAENSRTSNWINYAEKAIAQIAGVLQTFMCGSCSFDNWIVMYSLSLESCKQHCSSSCHSKISVASCIQTFLLCLTTMIQSLLAYKAEYSGLYTLVTTMFTGVLAPFNRASTTSSKIYNLPINQIDFPIAKTFSLKSQDQPSNTIHFIAMEPLHLWDLITYENGDTVLIHRLRLKLITSDSLHRYLHLSGFQNNNGETALMIAIKLKQYEFLSTLIPHEAGCIDFYGNTAITLILSSEDKILLTYITTILEYESEALRKLNYTDLMLEILSNLHTEPRLLDQVRQQTAHGYTALMLAVIVGNLPAVKILAPLEMGMRNKKLKQAGTLAFEMNRQDCIDLLLPYEDIRDTQSNTALHRAVMSTLHSTMLYDLERYKHMIGKYNASGRTALMEAALCGNTEAVIALIDHEKGLITPKTIPIPLHIDTINKRCKTITGVTAFMLCIIYLLSCDSNYGTIMHILSEKESSVVCPDGITPLMLLGILNKPFFYPFCLQTLEMIDNKGKTALMYAAENGAYDLIPLLLEHEGGIQDPNGLTALLYLVRNNNIADSKVIAELAKREGTMVNQWGWSPLMYAIHNTNNNIGLIQLLLQVSTQEQIAQARIHVYNIRRSDLSKDYLANLFSIFDIV